MKLIKCYIENFGKISKKEFSFKEGLNCIKEDNGSGKTTLAAFIKVMLYGMSDTKKASLDENERKRYLPWQGGTCGGSLTFESGGRVFRIERSFAPKASDDSFAVYDTANGRLVDSFNDGVGQTLFGINADGFERTVFLSERALSPKTDNRSISAKLSDLVGCDGDIGGLDDAMKILEEQRKFYHKKGGSGELSDVQAKIDDINRRLEGLGEIETALESARRKITNLSTEIEAARGKERMMMGEREAASLRVAQNDYSKQYADMKISLEESIRKRTVVAEVFGAQIPTFSEIDEASFKLTEASRLEEAIESPERIEFSRLCAKFDGKIDKTIIEGARTATVKAKEQNDNEKDPSLLRAKKLFKGRTPSEEELDVIEKLVTQKKNSAPILAIIGYVISVIAIIGGAFINPIISIVGVVGAVISAVAHILRNSKIKREKQLKIDEFFSSVSGVKVGSDEEACARIKDMRSSLILLRGAAMADVGAFEIMDRVISLFPDERGGDRIADCERIIAEYDRYAELAVAERYIMGDRRARIERAERLRCESAEFLSRFNTKTSSPYQELRNALTEYDRLTAEIVAKRDEMARLESMNTIGEGNQQKARADVEAIDKKRQENDARISELSRELALTERLYHSYNDELEMRDELYMRRGELEEILAKHKSNYETVLLTKKYITLAKDNMTSRYLGKTKAGFVKYAEMIGGTSGESFEMDTDFGIKKQDGGSTRAPEAYSKGTRDLYSLATRLGLIDALYEKDKPFIILDDPFSAFDDVKTEKALKLLREFSKERQIIYFTCSKARSV